MFLNFIICLILTMGLMPLFIRFMHKKQFGQEIRDEGPKWHQKKAGTPAMGGLVFLGSAIVTLIINQILHQTWNPTVNTIILTILGFGLVGFIDDFLKIFKRSNTGLTSLQKLIGQIISSVIICGYLFLTHPNISVPLPFGWQLTNHIVIGLFLIVWMTGFSNAFNLTDGLDGLSSGNGIISFLGFLVIGLKQQNYTLAVICATIGAGLIGFLIFNVKPAKIFMGDAGSLALGATLAVMSVLVNNPWVLLGLGIIYILETLSVIIQVLVYKKTGKRVFKMSPIHHHFEMSGWSEWEVDIVFWMVTCIGTIIGVLLV